MWYWMHSSFATAGGSRNNVIVANSSGDGFLFSFNLQKLETDAKVSSLRSLPSGAPSSHQVVNC